MMDDGEGGKGGDGKNALFIFLHNLYFGKRLLDNVSFCLDFGFLQAASSK